MSARDRLSRWRRAEARGWTGAAAHLIGGALDFAGALLRYVLHTRARPKP